MTIEMMDDGVVARMNARLNARRPIAWALTVLVGTIVLLMPEIAFAATSSRPPKSLWSVMGAALGATVFISGLPAFGCALYLALRRTWVAIGVPVLISLPLVVFAHWQNVAIAGSVGKLAAISATITVIGLLSAAGIGLAKAFIKEANRIGGAATAMATALPIAFGAIGPLAAGFFVAAGSQLPAQSFQSVFALVALGFLALTYPLALRTRSVAGTMIGTCIGFLQLAWWPVVLSNAVDAGQGFLVIFFLIPLIPLVLLLARLGAKHAGNTPTPRQGVSP
jgi:hypothetical protein